MLPHPSLCLTLLPLLTPRLPASLSVMLILASFCPHCLFLFVFVVRLCLLLACLLWCVSPLLHVLGGVWQHWEVTKEVNDDRPSIMLYGLCMVLPWRVAALCSNSEHSVPPYNLAGALLFASSLLGECSCVWDTGRARVWLTHLSVSHCVFVIQDVCGRVKEGMERVFVHTAKPWAMSFHYGLICHCWEHHFQPADTTRSAYVCMC